MDARCRGGFCAGFASENDDLASYKLSKPTAQTYRDGKRRSVDPAILVEVM